MSFYNATAHARQSQASPSVSLEKGAYRLRAPPSKRPSSHLRHRTRDSRASRDGIPPALRYGKQMAVLVMFLICATVACFATAYYLFTTRWDTASPPHSRSGIFSSNDIDLHPPPQVIVDFNVDFNLDSPDGGGSRSLISSGFVDPEERFLAYLPHSGFHNQRIAFENALVLSRLLNRTLLVPPVRLGSKSLSYAPYEALLHMLIKSSKQDLSHCRLHSTPSLYKQELSTPGSDCVDYLNYTYVPWEWLVDLSAVKADQKLLHRWNFKDDWLRDSLELGQEDTFALRDSTRDMYGFQDFISYSNHGGRKYQQMIHLSTLAHRSERLIHLGTLFGSSRLHLRNPSNLLLRKAIRKKMADSNPLLDDIARSIALTIGATYLGAHVRLGDGQFEENAERNVRLVWWKLVHGVLGYSVEQALDMERNFAPDYDTESMAPPELPMDIKSQDSAPKVQFSRVFSYLPCNGRRHTDEHLARLNIPLFISTDSLDRSEDPRLASLVQTFPCTFFLADFAEQIGVLDRLYNAYDGLALKPFLVPLLDAMVVARGTRVVGTEGSTFSCFIEDVLWRVYHKLDIISKG
ncbi:hypothetical protein PHLCEN_2v46 [Hermanssonia centrifuga]|uniref:Uncharacterized protein n=1 Tax=Hermanssonia centrifuga TaxID=98765 RepID=A0A2R6S7G1_9APHY|nr:hypothetical protein PHLCEN_2v46 [Hermanssonia centrifuga]